MENMVWILHSRHRECDDSQIDHINGLHTRWRVTGRGGSKGLYSGRHGASQRRWPTRLVLPPSVSCLSARDEKNTVHRVMECVCFDLSSWNFTYHLSYPSLWLCSWCARTHTYRERRREGNCVYVCVWERGGIACDREKQDGKRQRKKKHDRKRKIKVEGKKDERERERWRDKRGKDDLWIKIEM